MTRQTERFGHDTAQRPREPIGAGMQEQAKLVGLGRMARSAIGGEVVLPGPGAIEPLVEVLGAPGLEVADDAIPTTTLRDLRDRALIATLSYSFASITAVPK